MTAVVVGAKVVPWCPVVPLHTTAVLFPRDAAVLANVAHVRTALHPVLVSQTAATHRATLVGSSPAVRCGGSRRDS